MKSKNKSLTNICSVIETINKQTHNGHHDKGDLVLTNNKHVSKTINAHPMVPSIKFYKTPHLKPTIQLYKMSSSHKKQFHSGKIIKLNKSVSLTKTNTSLHKNTSCNNISLISSKSKFIKNSITTIPPRDVNTIIKAYAFLSNEGNVRAYNEDRVSIHSFQFANTGKHLYYFALFDGHGGDKCADYLKDNLFNFIITDPSIETNTSFAIHNAFRICESVYHNENIPMNAFDAFDRSGSTALVVIIIDSKCYCANVGDSRAFYSENGSIVQMNIEHKPNECKEKTRIMQAGGTIYQNKKINIPFSLKRYVVDVHMKCPWRVNPGGLSVSYIYRIFNRCLVLSEI